MERLRSYSLEAELTIVRKLLDTDGKALKSSETFYAGIFADASYTTLADNVDRNIVPLALNGKSSTSEAVKVAINQNETVTLYITEVDADGNPVEGAEGFMYKVSADQTKVLLDPDNTMATVTITNQEIAEAETSAPTETETETESNSVQTGDDTPLAMWFFFLIAALGVLLAGGCYRKRRGGAER